MSMEIGVYQLVAKGRRECSEKQRGIGFEGPTTAGRKNSILHVAARYGQVNFISEALKYLPTNFVNQKNDGGDTPLHLAAMHGHVAVAVARLVTSYHTDTLRDQEDRPYLVLNKAGDNPLHVVLRYGHLNVADQILTADSGFRLPCQ